MIDPTRHNSAPPPRRWTQGLIHHAIGLAGLVLFALLGLVRPVAAQGSGSFNFSAQLDQIQVTVGEPITYTMTLQYDGGQVLDEQPTLPDWGGLTVRSGPMSSRQISQSSVSGVQFIQNYQWQLVAPQEGKFTIGVSTLKFDGQVYQTAPLTVTVTNQPPANVPADLQGEPIVSAQTDDPEINRQLKGRLFLHAKVSNKNPYVGEPVIITYSLYNDRVNLAQLAKVPGDIQGALHEDLFDAKSVNPQTVEHGGKQYKVAVMYRIAIIPTKPGNLTINAYSMQGQLQINRQRQGGGGPFDDPFFNDPFFGGRVKVELPGPPIQLNVRPLPTDGQPAGFTGTVGDFTVQASLDRTRATTDDMVTVRVTVSGKGAVDLANAPTLPANRDFEVVGQNHKTRKEISPDGIGGSKTFELVLRPKHAGHVAVPAIPYPTFNPYSQHYVAGQTKAIPLEIAPGKGLQPPATQQPESAGAPNRRRHELNPIRPIYDLQPWPSERLINSAAFWALQLAALGLLAAALWRRWKLNNLDPTRVRREAAWPVFQRRLAAIQQQVAQGLDAQEAAGQLDHATRAFIADRFNLAADGLTSQEIERLLLEYGIPHERAARLGDLIEQCAALRYAPVGAASGEFGRWTEEITTLLKEGLSQ